jgi:hypothetical protein
MYKYRPLSLCPMGNGRYVSGDKVAGDEDDHSLLLGADVKNV